MTETIPPYPDRPLGAVLAGGRSLRMGRAKSAVHLDGISLLQRAIARLAPQTLGLCVSCNHDLSGLDLPHSVFTDTIDGFQGPLAGILASLRHARAHVPDTTHVATVPTDAPFFPRDLVVRLTNACTTDDTIAIAFSGDDMHPVFGLWPVALAEDLETFVRTDDKRRVRSFVARHKIAPVDFPLIATSAGLFDPFFNINTATDLEKAAFWLPVIEAMER